MSDKPKRGRPRKAVAPQKTRKTPLYFALAKCAEVVEKRFRKLESLQVKSGGNAANLWT